MEPIEIEAKTLIQRSKTPSNESTSSGTATTSSTRSWRNCWTNTVRLRFEEVVHHDDNDALRRRRASSA